MPVKNSLTIDLDFYVHMEKRSGALISQNNKSYSRHGGGNCEICNGNLISQRHFYAIKLIYAM